MDPLIPVVTAALVAAFEGELLFSGPLFLPFIIGFAAIVIYTAETAKIQVKKGLIYPEITIFGSKEEYIKSFEAEYVPQECPREMKDKVNPIPLFVAGVVAVALAFAVPTLLIPLNVSLAAFFLFSQVKAGAGLKLRPTFAFGAFIALFGVTASMNEWQLVGVFPLSVFFLKVQESKG